MSLDEPAWDPIWAEAQEHDLTLVIHSFAMSVPYPPGVWDNWQNVFLLRSAGHAWNAQRNMAAIIGGGVLGRFPQLRMTALECARHRSVFRTTAMPVACGWRSNVGGVVEPGGESIASRCPTAGALHLFTHPSDPMSVHRVGLRRSLVRSCRFCRRPVLVGERANRAPHGRIAVHPDVADPIGVGLVDPEMPHPAPMYSQYGRERAPVAFWRGFLCSFLSTCVMTSSAAKRPLPLLPCAKTP